MQLRSTYPIVMEMPSLEVTLPAYQLQLSLDSAAKPANIPWTTTSDARVTNDISFGLSGLMLWGCQKQIAPITLQLGSQPVAQYFRSPLAWIEIEVLIFMTRHALLKRYIAPKTSKKTLHISYHLQLPFQWCDGNVDIGITNPPFPIHIVGDTDVRHIFSWSLSFECRHNGFGGIWELY